MNLAYLLSPDLHEQNIHASPGRPIRNNSVRLKSTIMLFWIFVIGQAALLAQSGESKMVRSKIQTTAQCGMCKERIETAMAFEKGVKSSSLDLDTKILSVEYKRGKTSDEAIRKAITKLGYDADAMKKDEKAYAKLPGCCKMPDDPDYVKHE